jgi:hypothetical protein
MTTYRTQHDAHLGPWIKKEFGLSIEWNGGFVAFVGDYADPDHGHGTDDSSRFAAAMDYAGCHDGALFDRLNAIELGE